MAKGGYISVVAKLREGKCPEAKLQEGLFRGGTKQNRICPGWQTKTEGDLSVHHSANPLIDFTLVSEWVRQRLVTLPTAISWSKSNFKSQACTSSMGVTSCYFSTHKCTGSTGSNSTILFIQYILTILGYPGVIPLAASFHWLHHHSRMSKMTNENDPYRRAVI